MAVSPWFAEHWLDLLQTVGIIGGLLFTAHTTLRDERARKIGNLIAVNAQYGQIWKELYERPGLSRVLKRHVNLGKEPISDEEALFVNLLVVHLCTVYRAMKAGMFVRLEGLQRDIQEFFSLPIPKEIWEKAKPLQDNDFVAFVETNRSLG